MRALLQPFDQEFRLAGCLRPDRGDVVGRVSQAVRPELQRRELSAECRCPRCAPAAADRRRAGRTSRRARSRPVGRTMRGGCLAQLQRRAVGRDVGHHQQHGEELVQERDVARNHHEAGNRRNVERRDPPSSSTGKNGSAAMEKLSPGRSNCGGSCGLERAQLLVDRRELFDDCGARRPLLQEFGRRQRRRQVDGERRAVDVERDLEVDGAEVVLVDDDALAANLVERQRARRHVGDEDFADDADRDRRRQPSVRRRRVENRLAVLDQADAVEEVVAGDRERRDRNRLPGARDDAGRRRSGPRSSASTTAPSVSVSIAARVSAPELGGSASEVLIWVAMFLGTVSAGGSTTSRTPTMSNWSWARGCCWAEATRPPSPRRPSR